MLPPKTKYCYQRNTRLVAWVDIITSCLAFSMFTAILYHYHVVIGGGLPPELEKIIGTAGAQANVLLAVRSLMEMISAFLAVKLLQSSSRVLSNGKFSTYSEKWCTIWLIGCGLWLFLITCGTIKLIYGGMVLATLISLVTIIMRLSAMYFVWRYVKELKAACLKKDAYGPDESKV